jgi:hypothetical protein
MSLSDHLKVEAAMRNILPSYEDIIDNYVNQYGDNSKELLKLQELILSGVIPDKNNNQIIKKQKLDNK